MRRIACLVGLVLLAACGGRLDGGGAGGMIGGGAYGGSFIPIPPGSGGAGGRPYLGSGGYPLYGTGGYPVYGTGGYPIYGSGGYPIYGSGGYPIYGSGGIPGSGGQPGCSGLPACSTWTTETWTVQLIRDETTWRSSFSGRPDGTATLVYQDMVYDLNGQIVLDEWGLPVWQTTSCKGVIDKVALSNLRCVVESSAFQSAIRYGFSCTPSTSWITERMRFVDGATIYAQDTSGCIADCLQDEVMVNTVREALYSVSCTYDPGTGTGGSGGGTGGSGGGTGGSGGSSRSDAGVSDAPAE